MKVIGIAFMIIGVILGILNAIDKNKFGTIAAGLSFASAIIIVLNS